MKIKYLPYIILAIILIAGLFIFLFVIKPSFNEKKAPTPTNTPLNTPVTKTNQDTQTKSPVEIIAFFLSDPDDTFDQAQFIEAKKYAKEAYGVDVIAVDGSLEEVDMKKKIQELNTQGIKKISLHMKNTEIIKDELKQLINQGIVINSYFETFPDIGIPVIRSQENEVSFEMGKQMALKWKESQPDKPIVMVQFGYPKNTEFTENRTAPFIKGVISIDTSAKDLGCMDITKGSDAVKLYMLDLCEKHPGLNLIYIEDSSYTNDILFALQQAGRGQWENGKPKTEIICSAGCNKKEIEKIYDEDSSLKLSMGLSPIEVSHLRIDNLMNNKNRQELKATASCISWWSISKDDANKWITSKYSAQ